MKLHLALGERGLGRLKYIKQLKNRLVELHKQVNREREQQWSHISRFCVKESIDPLPISSAELLRKENVHTICERFDKILPYTCNNRFAVSSEETFPYTVYSCFEGRGSMPRQVWRRDHSCHSNTLVFEEGDEG